MHLFLRRRARTLARIATTLTAAATLAALLPGVAQAAPPSNDDFDSATNITTLPFTTDVDFTDSTLAEDDPWRCTTNAGLGSVWFDYTATSDGIVKVDLSNSGSATVAVYTGSRGALTLVPETCRTSWDDADLMPVTAGTTYHLLVVLHWQSGPIQLTVDEMVPPANDNFASAAPITTVPAAAEANLGRATAEPGEPNPSCVSDVGAPSAWFAFTAPRTEWIRLNQPSADYEAVLAVYTGDSLTGLTEILCESYDSRILAVTAGQTYHIQLTNRLPRAIPTKVALSLAPPLTPWINRSTSDPSTLDTITFDEYTSGNENEAITRTEWDFGDGTTATGRQVQHRFTTDGDYLVRVSVASADGRVGTATRTIVVRTHDVRITAFTVPAAGRPGQTKPIEVAVGNQRIPENSTVTLYKSNPGGFREIARATQYVPARPDRTVAFPFNYTFTPEDAAVGRITFRAVVTLADGVRDARTVDNEATAPATTVRLGANGMS
ncbi:MAG: PKD domain-containing protein [Actinomycetota bacterium]|nr:PKD domain-containing protein [Actinomycetota bacterium]